MDLSKQLKALTLSTAFSFDDYFKKGSAERTIFREHIVPFLSLDDLVHASAASRQMNTLCHSYTVGEILALYSMDHISREHKMELGKLIIGFVSRKYNHRSLHRRFIRTGTDSFWARLYHPCVVPEILLAMTAYFHRHGIEFDVGQEDFDWDANTDPETPILVKALFGSPGQRTVDVTVILRYLLMKQGNKRLILQAPQPSPRYWYIYLFGDPLPRVTKSLHILAHRKDQNRTNELVFMEDQRLSIKLRAAKPGDECDLD